MNLLRLFAGICLLFPLSHSQVISMSVCSDDVCKKDCVSWTANSGKCSPCQSNLGPCSTKNPSSIVTTSSMTLYSDSSCQQVISGTVNMPLLMDSGCNVLIGDYSSRFGSYRASNTSAIIGGIVGGVVLLIGVCVCSCCLCRRFYAQQRLAQDPKPPVNDVATNTYNPPVPYLTNATYSAPPTIQQPYYYASNVPDYTQGSAQVYPNYQQQPYYPTYYPQYVQAPPPSAPPSSAPNASLPSASLPTYYQDYSKSAI